jgi:23S rRNA pseudouridine1911/1915/1917 synthase
MVRGEAGHDEGAPLSRTSEIREFLVTEGGKRVDKYLAAPLDLSRSQVQRLIRQGRVTVGEEVAKASYLLSPGERIRVQLPPPEEVAPLAQELPLDIVYEDEDLAVVNKPAGMVVHPSYGHQRDTLVNALLARYPSLSQLPGSRPGIVHRLDKDTSGLMVVAKNESAWRRMQKQFKQGEVKKVYLALVEGHLKPAQGVIEAPIGRDPRRRKRMAVLHGGREAVTDYRVRNYFDGYTLVEAMPRTGRTHQVRLHLAFLGHPVVGDPVYGFRKKHLELGRQFLHSHVLGFRTPSGQYLEFEAPLPEELEKVLEGLRAPH